MAEYVWSVVRDRITRMFGGRAPTAEEEGDVLEAFQASPVRVLEAAAELEAGVTSGRVRSGWAVLRKRLGESRPDVTVSDTPDLAKRSLAAERWLASAGLYFERESQVVAALFEPGGLLAPFAQADFHVDSDEYTLTGDTGLVDRMVGLWRGLRPRGERAEAASLAWQAQMRREVHDRWRFDAERQAALAASAGDTIIVDEAERARVLAGLAAVA